MSACERGRAWEQALQVETSAPQLSNRFQLCFRQVFNNMHANKIAGDVVAFNAALSALDRGSQWQEDSFDQVNHYRFGRFGIA